MNKEMKIKNILVSQPKPVELEKTPYYDLIVKYNLKFEFKKFFNVVGLSSAEFRLSRVNLTSFSGVIFTSRNAIDYYFQLAKDLRVEIPESMKYFCLIDQIAFYLQKYIQFRKRKIFYGDSSLQSVIPLLKKHKEENLMLPCNNMPNEEFSQLLTENEIDFKPVVIFKNECADLSGIDIKSFDMLCVFSPSGVQSLKKNFPKYSQGNQLIAAYGKTTIQAAKDAKLRVDIPAPTPSAPSMTMAIEEFIKSAKKKK